jgi:hypothetical protein
MTAVDIAERRARVRAFGSLFIAALTAAVMVAVRRGWNSDFPQGLWLGLLVGSAVILLPINRWIRPSSPVVRFLDDEGTRENRRLSCTLGFWAVIVVALLFGFASHFEPGIAGEEVGQIVATAGIASAMVAFAILELRAAR